MNCAGGATECSPARERWVSSRESPQPQRGERLVRSTSFGPLGLIPFPNSYPALTRWATFCRAYGAEPVSAVAIRSHLLKQRLHRFYRLVRRDGAGLSFSGGWRELCG